MRDAEIGDAGLRDDAAVRIVDVEDAVEAAHHQQHRILQRQRAARQRRARAARHNADVAHRCNISRMRETCSTVSGKTTTSGIWR
jgi:hypothetical protein